VLPILGRMTLISQVTSTHACSSCISLPCRSSYVESNAASVRHSVRTSDVKLSIAATCNSPFTEKYSPKKTQGSGLLPSLVFPAERNSYENTRESSFAESIRQPLYEGSSAQSSNLSDRDGEDLGELSDPSQFSSQLPELREVLAMLRQRWEEEAAIGKRRRGPGNVFLVGTGPGDPELLTVKALRLMQSADLVLYDRLVSTDILDLVHSGARLLYVGKTSGYHSRTQVVFLQIRQSQTSLVIFDVAFGRFVSSKQ
jgi:hypothetical protein